MLQIDFAIEIFGDDTDSFKMKKYTIYLHKIILEELQKVTFYAICDTEDHPRAIKKVIRNLSEKFKETYPSVDVGCMEIYRPFEEVITKGFGDLRYRTEDRLKKVFF